MKNVWKQQTIKLYKYWIVFKTGKKVARQRRESVWASCASLAHDIFIKRLKRKGIRILSIDYIIREDIK